MKTIYILRHGKSSWEHPELSDYDRPLLPKGEHRTKKIAKYLKKQEKIPQLILTSPAKRAKQTAKIANSYLETNVKKEDNLYPGNSQNIQETIFGLDNQLESVMIVGHNPALTNIVREFMDPQLDWLSTSSVAMASWDTDKWEEIALHQALDVRIISPKQLKQ